MAYACDKKRRPTTLMALAVAAMVFRVFVIVMTRGGTRGTLIEVVSTCWSRSWSVNLPAIWLGTSHRFNTNVLSTGRILKKRETD